MIMVGRRRSGLRFWTVPLCPPYALIAVARHMQVRSQTGIHHHADRGPSAPLDESSRVAATERAIPDPYLYRRIETASAGGGGGCVCSRGAGAKVRAAPHVLTQAADTKAQWREARRWFSTTVPDITAAMKRGPLSRSHRLRREGDHASGPQTRRNGDDAGPHWRCRNDHRIPSGRRMVA